MPSKILVGNNEISDVLQIANSFNDFFTNIGKNLADNITETGPSPMTFMSGFQQVNSFFLNYISASEISLEISNLKKFKSCGPFSVPIKILKLIKEYVSVPLEKYLIVQFLLALYLINSKLLVLFLSINVDHNSFLITIDLFHCFLSLVDFLRDLYVGS